jgi:hypothetical protein
MKHPCKNDIDSDVNHCIENNVIPSVLKDSFQNVSDLIAFNTEVYQRISSHLIPALHKLMIRQYPVFAEENRPKMLIHLDDIIHSVSYSLMVKLYTLLRDQQENIQLREKYSEFEKWIKFYAMPQKAVVLEKEDRPEEAGIREDEWEIYRLRVNKEIIDSYNLIQNRMKDFVRTVHFIIFEQLPELLELNADEWIVFSVIMRDEYTNYSALCNHAANFIHRNYPEEALNGELYKQYLMLPNTIINPNQ